MDNPYRYPPTRGGFPSHEEARKQIGIDPEDCLPLADAATGLTGPAANAPDLTAGRPQGPRSTPAPAIPTPQKGSALRIDLRAGIVDFSSLPPGSLYGDRHGLGRVAGELVTWRDSGEYRRILDMTTENAWSWSTTLPPDTLVVTRLTMARGAV